VSDVVSLRTVVEPGESIGRVLCMNALHRDKILPLQSRKKLLVVLPDCISDKKMCFNKSFKIILKIGEEYL
jgi:hypothetical protein